MVATVGSIQVLFNVNHGQYERNVLGMAGTTEKSGKRMETAVRNTDRATQSLNRTMARMRGREFRVLSLAAMRTSNSVERLRSTLLATTALFGGFSAAFSLKALMDYSDTYKEVGNRLRVVKKEAQSLAGLEQKIFETAQKSRAEYASTGILYARLANSARRLQISQQDVLRVTETIQKSFVVGGSTGAEATQSAIQLSQGIASNRLQGDELRSVLENPALGQLLADEITGGNIGMLREIAAEGKLTAGVLIRAFKSASGEIDRLFDQTQETIGQAFVKLDNAMLRYIGTNKTAATSARATVVAINAIVENFDTLGDSLVTLGVAMTGLLGARALGGVTSSLQKASIASKAYRIETMQAAIQAVALTKAEERSARSKMLRNRLDLNKAYREGLLTTKQVERLEAQTANSVNAHNTAVRNAVAAQRAYKTAQDATTLSTRASTLAMRGLNASMAFLGGPVGIALLALGGAMYFMSKSAAEAKERSDRYSEAIEKAGDSSDGASSKIRGVAAALAKVGEQKDFIDLKGDLDEAKEDLAAFKQQLKDIADEEYVGFAVHNEQVRELISGYLEGSVSIDEFKKKLNELAAANLVAQEVAKTIRDTGDHAEAAQGKIDGLVSRLADLDGKEVEIKVKAEISQDVKDLLRTNLQKQSKSELEKAIRSGKKPSNMDLRMYGHMISDNVKPPKPKMSEAQKAARRADRQAKRDVEKYITGMEKLRNSGAEVFLDEFDQRVVQSARSLGLAESAITEFVDAARTGKEIPSQFALIRTEIDKIASNERLVRMADGISQGFGDLFTSIVDGSKSAGDAFLDFGKKIQSLVLQMLVVEPLVRSLRSAILGSTAATPMGGDPWAGLRVPTAHSGWTVGKGSAPGSKVVNPSVFDNAPRFHSGLRNNEIAAILEQEETVLTKDQSKNVVSQLSGMKMGSGGNTVVNIYNESGAPVEEQRRQSGGTEFVDILIGTVNKGISQGKMNKTMNDKFGSVPRRKQR